MFAVKVVCLLALALTATAQSDLDRSLALMACVKRALTVGVPELGVAKFDPYIQLQKNFSWTGSISGVKTTVTFHDLILARFPTWTLKGIQTALDTDPFAGYGFNFHWDRLQVNGSVTVREKIWKVGIEQHGSVSFDFRDTAWIGGSNVTRRSGETPANINELEVNWSVKELYTYISGLGPLNRPVGQFFSTGISTVLNHRLIGNLIGDTLREYLNPNWYSNGKVFELIAWCGANPEQ